MSVEWEGASADAAVGVGPAYFRKALTVEQPESGRVDIACDDRYQLFVNGRRIGVQFRQFLRPEQNFASVEALCVQIARDADQARAILAAG